MTITVIKRDGSRADYDGYEIARSIEEAATGLPDQVSRATQLRAELEITLFDGISSEQLDEAVIGVALQNVKDDPAFDTIASRLLVKTLYKKIFGEGVTRDEVYAFHGPAFVRAILRGVELGLLDERLAEAFDLERLGSALDPDPDDLLRHLVAAQEESVLAWPEGYHQPTLRWGEESAASTD